MKSSSITHTKVAFKAKKRAMLISAHNHHHPRWTIKGISIPLRLKTALKIWIMVVVAQDQCASRTIALAIEMDLNAMGPVRA